MLPLIALSRYRFARLSGGNGGGAADGYDYAYTADWSWDGTDGASASVDNTVTRSGWDRFIDDWSHKEESYRYNNEGSSCCTYVDDSGYVNDYTKFEKTETLPYTTSWSSSVARWSPFVGSVHEYEYSGCGYGHKTRWFSSTIPGHCQVFVVLSFRRNSLYRKEIGVD